jgi:hypothetical protein
MFFKTALKDVIVLLKSLLISAICTNNILYIICYVFVFVNYFLCIINCSIGLYVPV